jgi:hypothetical protein
LWKYRKCLLHFKCYIGNSEKEKSSLMELY